MDENKKLVVNAFWTFGGPTPVASVKLYQVGDAVWSKWLNRGRKGKVVGVHVQYFPHPRDKTEELRVLNIVRWDDQKDGEDPGLYHPDKLLSEPPENAQSPLEISLNVANASNLKLSTKAVELQAEVDRLKAENAKLRAEQAEPETPEFKIGDLVQLASPGGDWNSNFKGVVVKVAYDGEIVYVMWTSKTQWYSNGQSPHFARELLLVPAESRFKVGDKVVHRKPGHAWVGTVNHVGPASDEHRVGVTWTLPGYNVVRASGHFAEADLVFVSES